MSRKVIPSTLRRRWAEQLESGAQTEAQIAKKDGFDVRTVRAQVARAQEELAAERARAAALQSAMTEHYGDLCALANGVAGSLALPPARILPAGIVLPLRVKRPSTVGGLSSTLLSSHPHADRLIVALAQHLPRSSLWADIRKWGRIVDVFKGNRDRLSSRLEDALARAGLDDVSGRDAALRHLESLAAGGGGILPLTSWRVEGGVVWAGVLGIARADLPEHVREAFLKLLDDAAAWPETRARIDLYRKARELLDRLRDELETIALRRVVPGSCRYCPGRAD